MQEYNETFFSDHLVMTAAQPVWDPYADIWESIEREQEFKTIADVHHTYHLHSDTTRIMASMAATMDGVTFARKANKQVRVNAKRMEHILPRNIRQNRKSKANIIRPI